MNKLCCVLNEAPLDLRFCTCNIKMCYACLHQYQDKPSRWFRNHNSVADYHLVVSPNCPGVKEYERERK